MKPVHLLLLLAIACCVSTTGAQWVQTNGPWVDGAVLGLAVKGSSLFVGSQEGMDTGTVPALSVSTDNGMRWRDISFGFGHYVDGGQSLYAVEVFGGYTFVANKHNDIFNTTGWFYRSSDNGASWMSDMQGIGGIVVCLTYSGTTLFAGTWRGGVFMSADSGSTWTAANAGLANTHVSSLAVYGNTIIAGTEGGVFLSTNNGASWTGANSGLTCTDVRCLAISGTTIVAGTDSGGVFLSSNSGLTWRPANTGLTDSCANSLAVNGSSLFVGTRVGVFRSTDTGTTWTVTGLMNREIGHLAIGGTTIFAGSGEGLFVSTDNGANWIRRAFRFAAVQDIVAIEGNLFAGTYGEGVFLSTNSGASWTAVNNGLTLPYVWAFGVSGTSLFAGTWGSGVFRSTNNGMSWAALNTPFPTFSGMVTIGSSLFAGTWGGVFLSTNNGTSWDSVNAGLTSRYVRALAVSGTNLFAGTYGGVFLSTNNGTSWTAVNNGLTNTYVTALTVAGTNLFAGTWGGVFLSTNNGTNWTASGLANYVTAFAVSGTNLFAGTYGDGVFLSTNNGASWTAVNSGLNAGVDALSVCGTHLFRAAEPQFGPRGRIWGRPLSEMVTGIRQSTPMPQEFVLHQNYPNPFNPSTTIRYALPQRAAVTLTVYNTLGQEVARLVQGEKEAGYHEAVFDASSMASGVYLYRLTAGSFVETRKLLLMR